MQMSRFSYLFPYFDIFHSSDWQPELRDTALGRRSGGSNNRLPLKILQEKYLGGTQRYYKKYFGLTLQNITRKIIQLCHPYILQENFTGRSDKTEYLLKLFKRQLLGHDAIAIYIKIERKQFFESCIFCQSYFSSISFLVIGCSQELFLATIQRSLVKP